METESRSDKAMYGFVGCTAKQFMTRTVITVSRQTTMRELATLFEKHDFNAFPVMEDGKLVAIHHRSSPAPLQRIDEPTCSRSND